MILRRLRDSWRYRRLLGRMAGPRLLRRFAQENPEAVFVEIGANDGEQHDKLRPFILDGRWRGVMVEPVPYIFERLRANYGHLDRVALERAAVGEKDGELPFFHVMEASAEDRPHLPNWYDGLGSLSREVVMSHAPHIPDLADRLRETTVPVLSFGSLLEKHGLGRPDLVLTDTEGYDWRIIRAMDLATQGPRLLVYEHFHLPDEERADAVRHLRENGYLTLEEAFDTFCLRAEGDELTRFFQALRPAVAPVTKLDEPA